MAEHGGYRRPEHPAAVSGPGALSARTDGGPTQPPQVAAGGPYGSRQEQMAVQQGAPLQGGGGSTPAPVPFDAPTANPGEPVTAGADLGPGIGPVAAGIKSDHATSSFARSCGASSWSPTSPAPTPRPVPSSGT